MAKRPAQARPAPPSLVAARARINVEIELLISDLAHIMQVDRGRIVDLRLVASCLRARGYVRL